MRLPEGEVWQRLYGVVPLWLLFTALGALFACGLWRLLARV
jgi:hypothetical protein